jgi:hypothetical protein
MEEMERKRSASLTWNGKRNRFVEQDSHDTTEHYDNEPLVGADFLYINEKPVDDVSVSLFYQPRTLTTLCIVILALIHVAFNR